MASPYVHERQSEYWTSRQVEEFLQGAGFEVITFPLPQYHERKLPADFLFFEKNRAKLFGFQYKALYQDGMDFWQMDDTQHKTLINHPWIYYCLSELKGLNDFHSALQSARIVLPATVSSGKLYSNEKTFPIYGRWDSFFQELEQCHKGILVKSREHLNSILSQLPPELVAGMVDMFMPDFESRHAVHFVPSLDFSDPRNSMYIPLI